MLPTLLGLFGTAAAVFDFVPVVKETVGSC